MDPKAKLEKEIEELEKQLEKNRFNAIFDRSTVVRQEKKLKKLRKALENLPKK